MSKKILIIGAGPTSSLIAYRLRQLHIKVPLDVQIWEGSSCVGGRFSTTKNPQDEKCYADLGAQYLTHTKSRTWSKSYFDCLIENKLIQRFSTTNISGFVTSSLQDDKENYVCKHGTAEIVQFFINKANVNSICLNKKVLGMNVKQDTDGVKRVEVILDEQQQEVEFFDIVISTLPVPQLLQLRNINQLLDSLNRSEVVKAALANVSYTSRYALGLFYQTKLELKCGEQGMNYVDNDPIIRYWTVENEKRALGTENYGSGQNEINEHSSVVIHTTVKFGAANMDKDLEEIKELVLKHIDGQFKTIEGVRPDYIKCVKWTYSQTNDGYPGCPGFIEVSNYPVILAAGDGFSFSGIEGCILSAEKTVEKIIAFLRQ